MDTKTNAFTSNTWTKRLEWEPLTEFKSGNVSATVNILRIRIPEYSYRIVTLHPNGALKGSFIQYKVDDLPFDHHLDVLKVVEEAHNFIKEKMELHKAEEAKQREAALAKEAEDRTKKVNKKSQYLANKERRREQNRSTRHGSGGGGKKKGQS